jgi:hypothetical protein
MLIYLLIALPHLLGLVALLAWAFSTGARGHGEETDEGHGGGGGGLKMPPLLPQPVKPGGGLPLAGGVSPSRRLRAGERLSELYPVRVRRRSHPRPDRTPTQH